MMDKFVGGIQGFFIGIAVGVTGGSVAFYFLCARVEKVRKFIFKG